jgi:hypothetical protein
VTPLPLTLDAPPSGQSDKRSPGERHESVTNAALTALTEQTEPAVIVDSPPGAGKSTFVVRAAAQLAEQGQVPIVAQTNAQADDLVAKLLAKHPNLMIGRLTGSSYDGALEPGPGLAVSNKLADLPDADIVIGTSAKWGHINAEDVPGGGFPVGIIDEAYQMRSDQLLYVADLFPRALMVGDPGQLNPFTPVDDTRWRGQPDGPVTPAVATVLHHHPTITAHRLPVSWRLSARCAPLVSDAFYRHLRFDAGTTLEERMLHDPGRRAAEAASIDEATGPLAEAVDRTIATAVESGWAQLELPHRVTTGADADAVDAVARTALGVLHRNLEATDSGDDAGPVGPERIAVGVAHRIQRSAVQIRLAELGRQAGTDVSAITVDTANRIQGREYHVVIVLHPLSGRAAASEFHLETGRLCVLLSRHRHACIVVTRAGIADVLHDHPMSRPVWIGADIPVPDGWEANHQVLEQLSKFKVTP